MKRRRQQLQLPQDDSADSQPLHRSARVRCRAITSSPLLDALTPLLPLFHPFLNDHDAARLLRTSRTTALALLPSYAFTSHMFRPASLASLRRLRDLCVAYKLRISQLALPHELMDLSCDATPPHHWPIPASVTALSLSPLGPKRDDSGDSRCWAALSAAAAGQRALAPARPLRVVEIARRGGAGAAVDERRL